MISLNTDTDPLCFIYVLNIRSSNRSTCNNNSLREGGKGGEGKERGKRIKRREEERGERKVHQYMYIMHGIINNSNNIHS